VINYDVTNATNTLQATIHVIIAEKLVKSSDIILNIWLNVSQMSLNQQSKERV